MLVAAIVLTRAIAANATSSSARAYGEAPPAGYTGGFGEPTCASCHSDYDPVAEGLALTGMPERYEPGASYRIRLTLSEEFMVLGGFEAAVRFADGPRVGAQAGALAPADSLSITTDSAGVTYVHHRPGGVLTPEGRAVWNLDWIAPAEGGAVVLNAAANAANGDLSPLGDLIVTGAFESAGP